MYKSLLFLEQAKNNLRNIDYNIIYKAICDMPNALTKAKIRKGEAIDRVRINNCDNPFNSISDISYITDYKVLEKLEFGRANKEKQGIFYGAIESSEIRNQRIVSYFETSKIFSESDQYDTIEEVFTVSRWIVKEEFEVIQIVFSDETLTACKEIKEFHDYHLSFLKGNPYREYYLHQLRFISNEFSKVKIKTLDDYKISAAYANYIWNNTNIKGIIYPSVQSKYKGQNIALTPDCVDKYLELKLVCMCKFERRNNIDLPIKPPFKIVTDFGINKKKFIWENYFE